REGAVEGPRRARRLRRRRDRRSTAGRGANRACGHDRPRQRSPRPLSQGPQAGDRAARRWRGIPERRRRGGADPVRDRAEDGGMSDPSALTGQALAAIGKEQASQELDQLENEYLGRKSGRVSKLLEGIGSLDAQQKAALGKAVNDSKRAIE